MLPEPKIKDSLDRSDLILSGDNAPTEFVEDAALSLVVNDAAKAESWINERQWSLFWKESDLLYQSPRKLQAWEGTTVTKSNVTRFKVASHVQSIVPKLISGLFYSDPPFLLRPRPGTTQDTVRSKTAVFTALLDEINFKRETASGLLNTILFGTGIYKYGWLCETKKCKRYVRTQDNPTIDLPLIGRKTLPSKGADEFRVEDFTEEVERPFFEAIDIRHVLVDPGCRRGDIRRAKYVIHKMYLTFEDLDNLRGVEGYEIPEREELLSLFLPETRETAVGPGPGEQYPSGTVAIHHAAPRNEDTTLDPTQRTLEVLERWDKDRVITVLNRKLTIRNEQNPIGDIPFLSSNWWDIPDSFYGIGVGHIVGQEQRVEQGVVNAALDTLALSLNQQYVRNRNANITTQNIRQRLGGIIDVDGDVDKALKLMEVPRIPGEVWTTIQASNAAAESASGANELLVQGSMPTSGRTSMGRTATGAGNMAAASDSRLQTPLDAFIDQVFVPFIVAMDALVNERMPVATLRKIVGQELGDDFTFNPEEYLNAKLRYEVLAGSHLQAKRAMTQSLPLMIQILENPTLLQQLQQTGYTVDVSELFKMILETSEWKNSREVIRPLNPQEQQALQASNPAMQKVQGQIMVNQQQQQAKSALQDQENVARAAREVLRQTFEKAAEPMALNGEPQ